MGVRGLWPGYVVSSEGQARQVSRECSRDERTADLDVYTRRPRPTHVLRETRQPFPSLTLSACVWANLLR